MSSQSKRRAESEDVAHKKKPRRGGDSEEEDEFHQDEKDGLDVEDDDVGALDKNNPIPTDRRTRGKLVDYTKVGLSDDNGFKLGDEVSKENKGAPAGPRTRSPERTPVVDIKKGEEDDEDEEEGEWEDEDDDVTDDYDEDEEE